MCMLLLKQLRGGSYMLQCECVWSDLSNIELTDSYGNKAKICIEAGKVEGLDCVTSTSRVGGYEMKYGISYGASGMREVLYMSDGSCVMGPETGKQFEDLKEGPFQIQRVFPNDYSIHVYGVRCVEATATYESIDVSIDVKDTYESEYGPSPVSMVSTTAEIGRLLVLMVANGWYSCSNCAAIKGVLEAHKSSLSSVFKAAEGK